MTDEVPDAKEALAGARDILTEQPRRGRRAARPAARLPAARSALLTARVVKGQEEKGAKFSDYFAHSERWSQAPSHRALAMMRGANEGVLTLDIGPDPEPGCRRSRRWSRPRSASPATRPATAG